MYIRKNKQLRLMFTRYICILFVLFAFSCGKNRSQIPNVLVDITVNVNNPSYMTLTAVGGFMYFSGGSRGIIVFRTSTEEFNAFDRHCPYEPEETCGVLSMQSDNVTMKCACCASIFSLYNGSLQSGPAVQPLKKYTTTFDGTNLRIYN
jgi:nitrite reductase/ring-hydroxylating ferredoxin subunit